MFGFLKRKMKSDASNNRRRYVETSNESKDTDFKVENNSENPRRGRVAAKYAAQLFLILFLTAAVVLLGVLGYRHAVTSDYFKLTEVTISGNERLKNEDLLSSAAIKLGVNIFAVDIASARRKLLENPWIETAELVRRLPGSIIIRIAERKPRALVNLDVLYLVDDMGRVFKRWVRGDPILSPVITGISREEYLQSQSAVEAVLCDTIDLADRYAASGLERISPLQEIYREEDDGFSLTVGKDPAYVKLGKGPYKTKLIRLNMLLRRLSLEQKRPGQIFFDNEIRPDRITVKLKEMQTEEGNADIIGSEDESKKIMSKI
jgi:cell division protein FtsQ